MINKYKSIVSVAYDALHTHIFLLDNKRNTWNAMLSLEMWPNDFTPIVRGIWSITNNSKLRSFQYRLLMHALTTNCHLKRWNILQSDLCTFCNDEPETICHIFWECPLVRAVWARIAQMLTQLDPGITLDCQNVIFNNVQRNYKSVINTVVLVVKFNLYKSRCAQSKPNIHSAIDDILLYQKLEHMGAVINGREQYSNDKWQAMINLIKY